MDPELQAEESPFTKEATTTPVVQPLDPTGYDFNADTPGMYEDPIPSPAYNEEDLRQQKYAKDIDKVFGVYNQGDSYWAQRDLSMAIDPAKVKIMAPNTAFMQIHAPEGFDVPGDETDIGRQVMRKNIADKMFNGQGAESEEAFYAQVAKKAGTYKNHNDFNKMLQGTAATAAVMSPDLAQSTFTNYIHQLQGHAGYDPKKHDEYYKQWTATKEEVAHATAEWRPYANEILMTIRQDKTLTGPDGKTAQRADMGETNSDNVLAKTIASIPDEDFPDVMHTVRLMIDSLPEAERRGVLEETMRKTSVALEQMARDTKDFWTGTAASAVAESVVTDTMNPFTANEAAQIKVTEQVGEIKDYQANLDKLRNRRAEIRKIFDTKYNSQDSGFIGNILTAIPGVTMTSMAMAAPGVGTPIMVGSMYGASQESLYLKGREAGMTEAQAGKYSNDYAMVMALPQVLLEKAQIGVWTRKAKWLDNVVTKMDDAIQSKLMRGVTKFGVISAAETGIEVGQDVTGIMVEALAGSLSPVNPQVDMMKELKGEWNKIPEIWGSMIILSAIGAGGGINQEERMRSFAERSALEKQAYGFTPEAIARLDVAQQKGAASFAKQLDDENRTRAPESEEAKAAIAELRAQELANKKAKIEADMDLDMPRFDLDNGKWSVTDKRSGEKLAQDLTVTQAAELAKNHFDHLKKMKQEEVTVLTNHMIGIEATTPKGSSTVYQPYTSVSTENMKKVADEVGSEKAERIAFQTARLREQGDREAFHHIFGHSETIGRGRGRKTVNKIFAGATILTVFHEEAHGYFRQALDTNLLTVKGVSDTFKQLDEHLAKNPRYIRMREAADKQGRSMKFLPDNFDQLGEKEQFAAIDEAMAELAEIWVMKTRKNGTSRANVEADLISKAMTGGVLLGDKTGAKSNVRAFVSAMREYFGLQFARLFTLKQAIKEGKIDEGQINDMISKLYGTKMEDTLKDTSDREAKRILGEGEGSFSLGSKSDQVRKAKEDGFAIGPVYHGTNAVFDEFRTPAMFSTKKDYSEQLGKVKTAYLKLSKTADLREMHLSPSDPKFNEIAARLQVEGYDSAQYRDEAFIAFSPDQIREIREDEGGSFSLGSIPQNEIDKILPGATFIGIDELSYAEINGPVVVQALHGTTHTIDRFTGDRGNPENDMGVGIYATSSTDDVSDNYAGEGPDLTQRIELLAERIEQEDEVEMEEAREMAREKLSGGSPQVMPLLIPMKNPVVLEKGAGTFINLTSDANEQYRNEAEKRVMKENGIKRKELENYQSDVEWMMLEIAAENGDVSVIDKITSIIDEYGETDSSHIREALMGDPEGVAAWQLEDWLRRGEGVTSAETEDGTIATGEIIRRVFTDALGFDGIIDRRVYSKFKNMGLREDTVHVIVPVDTELRPRANYSPDTSFSIGTLATVSGHLATIKKETQARGAVQTSEKERWQLRPVSGQEEDYDFGQESTSFSIGSKKIALVKDWTKEEGNALELLEKIAGVQKRHKEWLNAKGGNIRSIHRLNEWLKQMPEERANLLSIQKRMAGKLKMVDKDGYLIALSVENTLNDKGEIRFARFSRSLPQMFLDRMDAAMFLRIHSKINSAMEKLWESKEELPKSSMPIGMGSKKSSLSSIEGESQELLVQTPIRNAEKTVVALNLNSACPMFILGNRGCWGDACYLTQMAKGATGTNLFERAMYCGEILQWSDEEISEINKIGGLRVNGVGDTTLDNVAQVETVIRHAAMRGLKIKMITKQELSIATLAAIKKNGGKIDHVIVQPSIDYYWRPIEMDLDEESSGVREIAGGDAERISKLLQSGDEELIESIYEVYGREVKNINGKWYRKDGFSWDQVMEMQEKYPQVKLQPRVIVGSIAEIIDSATQHPGVIITLMHGKLGDGLVSDFTDQQFNYLSSRHRFGWDSKTGEIQVFADGMRGRDTKQTKGHKALEEHINKTFDKKQRFAIYTNLKNQTCCQENDSKDACADCGSHCAMRQILTNLQKAKTLNLFPLDKPGANEDPDTRLEKSGSLSIGPARMTDSLLDAAMKRAMASPERKAKMLFNIVDRLGKLRIFIENRGSAFNFDAFGKEFEGVFGDEKNDTLNALAIFEGIVKALPPELRGRVGGFVTLAKQDSDEKRLEYLKGRLDAADKVIEKYLHREYNRMIIKLFDRAKPAKDEAGKKTVGKAGADVHAVFKELIPALKMTQDQVDEKIAGLEASLVKGDLSIEDETVNTILLNLIGMVGNWRDATISRKAQAIAEATQVFEAGYYTYRLQKLLEKEDRAIMREKLLELTGKAGAAAIPNQLIKERQEKIQKDAGLKGDWRDSFLDLVSFEQLLEHIFGLESDIVKRMVDIERRASQAKEEWIQKRMDDLYDLFTKLAKGSKLGGEKLAWSMQQKSITVGGIKFSQDEAIHWTMMWRQPDGRRHMEGMKDDVGKPAGQWNIDEDFMKDMESKLTPEAKAVRAHLSQVYGGEHAEINPTYKLLNGINMPKNALYSPLTVAPLNIPKGQMQDPVSGGGMTMGSITPPSLRTRGSAVAEPRVESATQIYIAHSKQIGHWLAYAPAMKEIGPVLRSRDLQNAMKARGGEHAVTVLNKWLDLFEQGGVVDASAQLNFVKWFNTIISNAAGVILVGRLSVLVIQHTVAFATMAEMPVSAFIKRFAMLLTGQLEYVSALKSDYIQNRIKQMPTSVQEIMKGLKASKPDRLKYWHQKLGQAIGGMDGLMTAGTYSMVYDYQMTQAKKMKLEGAAAENYARMAAERSVDRIAQPTRAGTRSIFENTLTSPAAKLSWAFASEARQKLMLGIWRTISKDRSASEKMRALAVTWIVGGVWSTIVRSAIRDLKDDQEDEKVFDEKNWDPTRFIMSSAVGPLQGIPFVGDLLEGAIYKGTGQYLPEGNMLSGFSAAAQTIHKLDWEEADTSRKIKDVEAILMGGGLLSKDLGALASMSHLVRDLYETIDTEEDKK